MKTSRPSGRKQLPHRETRFWPGRLAGPSPEVVQLEGQRSACNDRGTSSASTTRNICGVPTQQTPRVEQPELGDEAVAADAAIEYERARRQARIAARRFVSAGTIAVMRPSLSVSTIVFILLPDGTTRVW